MQLHARELTPKLSNKIKQGLLIEVQNHRVTPVGNTRKIFSWIKDSQVQTRKEAKHLSFLMFHHRGTTRLCPTQVMSTFCEKHFKVCPLYPFITTFRAVCISVSMYINTPKFKK